jgi:hypothetical protein
MWTHTKEAYHIILFESTARIKSNKWHAEARPWSVVVDLIIGIYGLKTTIKYAIESCANKIILRDGSSIHGERKCIPGAASYLTNWY